MTIIIALSDTHLKGPLSGGKYLPQGTIDLVRKAQLVLHAGDFTCQRAYDFLFDLCIDCQCELWAIQGNPANPDAPAILQYSNEHPEGVPLKYERSGERFGLKIGIKHDANGSYNFSEVYAQDKAANMEIEGTNARGADILVFGHIHEPIISWNTDNQGKRRLLVCPGPGTSEGLYHKCPSYPTAAQINVNDGKISSVQIISINK
jgi:predicted phosphodiesterase